MAVYFTPVYGLELARPISLEGLCIHPRFSNPAAARTEARDRSQLVLTGVCEMDRVNREQLFDLSACLTFLQQQWVYLNEWHEFDEGTTPTEALAEFPGCVVLPFLRPGGGSLVPPDTFDPEARGEFLRRAMAKLADEGFDEETGFRRAFFRNVECLRMDRYIDVTYYLNFCALELMARAFTKRDRESAPSVLSTFLKHHGFDIVKKDDKRPFRSATAYSRVRNMLFHEGRLQKKVGQKGATIETDIREVSNHLSRLVPDVLLRVLGYDHPRINWTRWMDRKAWK